jgi:hypothetical protein
MSYTYFCSIIDKNRKNFGENCVFCFATKNQTDDLNTPPEVTYHRVPIADRFLFIFVVSRVKHSDLLERDTSD